MTIKEAQSRLRRMRNQATEFVKSSPSHFYADIYRKDAIAIDMALNALRRTNGDCDTCTHYGQEWWEYPCDTCTLGGAENHYERSILFGGGDDE